tara:strand:+ start:85 stop:297 length:213 start_codon:yes stop_codon:yes gene_type:complete
MSEKDYPELETTLIEITEENIEQEEDIFPLIDYEDGNSENPCTEDPIDKLYRNLRGKIISIIRSKISYEN